MQTSINTLAASSHLSTVVPRILGSVMLASGITLGLFVLMDALTSQDEIVATPTKILPTVVLGFEPDDDPVIEREKIKPMPEPKKAPPTPPMQTQTEPSDGFTDIAFVPGNGVDPITIDPGMQHAGQSDRSASPVVRINPKYPPQAARDGIEGWVTLRFDISPAGTTENIQVIDAQPKRTFINAARRALAKWKYRPQFNNGQAVSQQGLQVMLEFNLDTQ